MGTRKPRGESDVVVDTIETSLFPEHNSDPLPESSNPNHDNYYGRPPPVYMARGRTQTKSQSKWRDNPQQATETERGRSPDPHILDTGACARIRLGRSR